MEFEHTHHRIIRLVVEGDGILVVDDYGDTALPRFVGSCCCNILCKPYKPIIIASSVRWRCPTVVPGSAGGMENHPYGKQ